ncbi:MAG: methionine aminotransferase [Gammaproteobacteria bacterium]|nr:methionine aminotransferase [Gammaproteobacteria bacterium]MDH5302590.1 methionine aminotransferase [Gammaproteobacteria bacterium]
MRLPLDSKLPAVGTTIFTVMSQLANDCDAINLSQGFPSFDPPEALTDRISYHLKHGANQYAPMPGVPALRSALASKTLVEHGRAIDADAEITICSGATEGIFAAIQAIVRRGDEVVVLDPAYDSYEPSVTLAGGITRHVPLAIRLESGEFEVDWQRLQDAINCKTRLVIVNFPHNPTGAILSRADLDRLAAILDSSSAYLVSDEVYEHIIFDGQTHCSVLQHDALWPRSFVISSFGKTCHATGWKIGYCIAPPPLTVEFRKVHQFTTFAVSTPMQHGIADFLVAQPNFPRQVAAFYQQKRDHFCKLLQSTRFRFTPARSTFFQLIDYGDLTTATDTEVAMQWTRDLRVASIPLSVFCEQAFTGTRLRFCFAKDDATLTEAVARLHQPGSL